MSQTFKKLPGTGGNSGVFDEDVADATTLGPRPDAGQVLSKLKAKIKDVEQEQAAAKRKVVRNGCCLCGCD